MEITDVKQAEASHEGEELQRSVRKRTVTEKMLVHQGEKAKKAEKKLMRFYSQWKEEARNAREQLKLNLSDSELTALIDTLEEERDNVMKVYDKVRTYETPSNETRRRVDACEAVTSDIVRIGLERISGVEEFDSTRVRRCLRELLDKEYAHSVYGSIVSKSSCKSESSVPISQTSVRSLVLVKRAEAAAELAAMEVEYNAFEKERELKEKLQLLEEKQRRDLDSQRDELERFKAESRISAARAKLEAYDQEASVKSENVEWQDDHIRHEPVTVPVGPSLKDSSPPPHNADVTSLAQAVQDSIMLNRLPTPEPTVFSGDPLHFIEWKASFCSLIDKRHISSADKLYFLKKYIAGPAKKALEGTFYRTDEEAYKDAWTRLQDRYGQPFIIQRAFREKLSGWPKIQSRDAEALRSLSDFLNACKDAMPHVKGLEILNDCEENRKLVSKLPEWAAARWNRQATQILRETQEFPSFKDFTRFMSAEAEIACNPITSFNALHLESKEKHNIKFNKTKAGVFSTETIKPEENLKSTFKVTPPCSFCQGQEHQIYACPKFSAKPLKERREFVKDARLCYGCLKLGHGTRDCRRRHICNTCKGRHPTCLHDSNFVKGAKPSSPNTDNARDQVATTSLSIKSANASTNTSMIVPVWLSSRKDPVSEKLVYALLDTQSDTVFIEEAVSQSLDSERCPVTLKLSTMASKDLRISSERVSGLRVRGFNSTTIFDLPPAYTKECIPVERTHIPTRETARLWKHLSKLSDQIPPLQDCEIGLLIGYNCSRALAPREVILGAPNEPYAIRTDLGWSIVGPSSQHEVQSGVNICHKISVKEIPYATPSDLIQIFESDFKDTNESTKKVSQEDIVFLQKLGENIKMDEDKHLEMPLPFKQRPYLPDNKRLALVRLQHLKRKMEKCEKYKQHYLQFMNDIIVKGEAERVLDEGKDGEKWYIPHHGVYHSKKPEKIRVVFDCSAQYKGTSLNEHLLTGPDLLNSLTGILLRFREHPVALMCDIERMFHQFHVDEADRNYLRFLWWKNEDLNSQPQTFRMKVHLFGAASSPGCANYGLKHLARKGEHSHSLGAKFILRDFYMDDGLTSVENDDRGIQLAREASQLCAMGRLRLHKFISNSKTVLESIEPSERAVQVTTIDLSLTDPPLERALGIYWDLTEDNFRFRVNLKDQPATRRGILSTVASLFDPLGFLAPFLLQGKAVLQEMCSSGIRWDDSLPDGLLPRWEKWRADLPNLEKIKVARCIVPADFGKITKREIHNFSDASMSGYGQCSYLRSKNERGEVHCTLLMAKARVAPLKITTIPRLELTAAVISVAVNDMIKEEINLEDVETFFWTDSKVVLGYIANEARRFHTFVANRIQRIHRSTTPQQWHYISSDENPADYASRGLSVDNLLTSKWFTGPKILWERHLPPSVDIDIQLSIGDPEVKKTQVMNTQTLQYFSLSDHLTKLSSWSKAIQAIARLLRRVKKVKSSEHSTVAEREDAKRIIIRDLQRQVYSREIDMLRNDKVLPQSNKLYSLEPFVDQDGLLKVGGRLSDTSACNHITHPVIIPKEHHLTKLLIADCHERTGHQGKGLTINKIRSGGFWIPGVNKTVASFVRQCVKCRKLRRPPEEQKMADLPSERSDHSPPFTYCGMDCFGPFITQQGRKSHKRYGLIFTCFCCRAVHIEMLVDLSTDAFINGLRCFIAIRGAVRQIRCDQGTNFVGAKNEFERAMQEIDTKRLVTFLAQKQCDFVFNAPHASHAGGVWERQIRTIRSVLQATLSLSSGRLDDSSLRTFFYEAMAIVNSRPLTVDNLNDPKGPEPLTPNHLLTLKSEQALPPPGNFIKEDLYTRKRWRRIQYLAEQFWSRWRREYLSNIALRQKWLTPRRNLQVGDIVLEKADDVPRNEWRLAEVIEAVADKDDLIRRVKIRFGDKTLGKDGKRLSKPSVVERPVQKLVLLLEAA